MKKYLSKLTTMWIVLFVLMFVVVGCGQNLKVVWSPNPIDERIEKYVVYKFEGDSVDWQNYSDLMLDSIGIVAHNPLIPQSGSYEFQFDFQETMIIRAGLIAIDSLTRRSDFGLSDFYFYPTENITVEIMK